MNDIFCTLLLWWLVTFVIGYLLMNCWYVTHCMLTCNFEELGKLSFLLTQETFVTNVSLTKPIWIPFFRSEGNVIQQIKKCVLRLLIWQGCLVNLDLNNKTAAQWQWMVVLSTRSNIFAHSNHIFISVVNFLPMRTFFII